MKRIISLILIAAMLTLSAVSCSNEPAETETNAPVETPGNESADAAQDAEEDKYAYAKEMYAAIPEYDFDGASFIIATTQFHGSETEVCPDGMNGEGINDALYLRTEAVNSRFDCKIERADDLSVSAVTKSVSSGDTTLKLVFPAFQEVAGLVEGNYLIDLLSVNSLNLEEAWYDQSTYDMQMAGKLFAINGDINYVDEKLTFMIYFNKDIAEQNQLGNLYDLVNEGKWTIDQFMTMSDAVSRDLDGNGKYDDSDMYGYLVYYYHDIFFYGSGLQWVTYNEEGMPELTVDVDRAVSVLEKMSSFFSSGHSVRYSTEYLSDIFKSGRGLFYAEVATLLLDLGDMEYDYGLIPLPKYDEAQENYHSYLFPASPAVAIPNNGNDTEMVGAVMEALAIQSHMLLKPAFYDYALQRRYSRDEESSEMLDIIYENRIYDFGNFYIDNLLDFGNLNINGSTTFASRYAKMKPIVESELEDFIESISDN